MIRGQLETVSLASHPINCIVILKGYHVDCHYIGWESIFSALAKSQMKGGIGKLNSEQFITEEVLKYIAIST